MLKKDGWKYLIRFLSDNYKTFLLIINGEMQKYLD